MREKEIGEGSKILDNIKKDLRVYKKINDEVLCVHGNKIGSIWLRLLLWQHYHICMAWSCVSALLCDCMKTEKERKFLLTHSHAHLQSSKHD